MLSRLKLEKDFSVSAVFVIMGIVKKMHNRILTRRNGVELHKFNAVTAHFGTGMCYSRNLKYHNWIFDFKDSSG